MFTIKFMFDYGQIYSCLWAESKTAFDFYGGYIITPDRLSITDDLKNQIIQLSVEYQSSLDWDYPPDPSPWNKRQVEEFRQKAYCVYDQLKIELGRDYEILNMIDDCLKFETTER